MPEMEFVLFVSFELLFGFIMLIKYSTAGMVDLDTDPALLYVYETEPPLDVESESSLVSPSGGEALFSFELDFASPLDA